MIKARLKKRRLNNKIYKNRLKKLETNIKKLVNRLVTIIKKKKLYIKVIYQLLKVFQK